MTARLLLQCGERHFALPVSQVRAVAPAATAMALPRAPEWVEGIAGYGRNIVPQIDLAALLGEGGGGEIAVVTGSGAGTIALRVRAAERVADIGVDEEGARSGDLVATTVRHGDRDIGLLDLSHLAIPVLDLPRATGSRIGNIRPRGVSSAGIAGTEVEMDLVCEVGGRRIALPLSRVQHIERAGSDTVMIDPLGEGVRTAAGAMAVSVSGAQGALVLGVNTVVGLRRAGAGANGQAIDIDGLGDGGAGQADAGDTARRDGERPRAMYLLGAAGRLALVPGSKALRVGTSEHWRDLQGLRGAPVGLVPIGGEILPAVDLGGLFGDAARRRPMVLAMQARDSRWAVACDSISERHATIEGRPSTVNGLPMLGVVHLSEGRVPVLDADRLRLPGAAP